ncbi:MAG: hypothetical protein PUB18_02310 [bacterium]|nr:hypothetical protein [bacterium]
MKQKVSKWISLFFDLEQTQVYENIDQIEGNDQEIIVTLKFPKNQNIKVIFSKKSNDHSRTNITNMPFIIIYLTTNQNHKIQEQHRANFDIYTLNIEKYGRLNTSSQQIMSLKKRNLIELAILLKKEEEWKKNVIIEKRRSDD